MHTSDICIAGAGLIGLTLALELHRRGLRVTVLDRDLALSHASTAAAGMLAAYDPDNPVALLPLSQLSLALYPSLLASLEELSGIAVPFQTDTTFQAVPDENLTGLPIATSLPAFLRAGEHRFAQLQEHSLDPRQLAVALLAAVRATPITLLEQTALLQTEDDGDSLRIETSTGPIHAGQFVSTLGAWNRPFVTPKKGQMLSVAVPSSLPLRQVIRMERFYIVPRLQGPRAGTAVIGATVEDAGFDTATHATDLQELRRQAAEFVPALAEEELCPMVEHWAGLRPSTPDQLPLLGATGAKQWIAAGHFRNGILLAPATARVMAETILGELPSVNLSAFTPDRFPG